jgi:ubiquinol-cytochrome c reductase cytochrome c subunit
MRRFITVFLATLTLVTLSSTAALAQDPNNGKELWEGQIWQCRRCHGDAGEGLYSGPRAGDELTAQEWIDQVRAPRRFMPSFSVDQVSDEQLIDMHAYMTSLPKPTGEFMPVDPGTADQPGQNLLLQKRCVACHTEANAEAGFLVEGLIERGQTPTTESVTRQLRTPFKNMPAYTESQVSDDEAALMADFLVDLVSAETPPAALPASGSDSTPNLPGVLMLVGSVLLLGGLFLRRLKVNLSAG